MHPSLINTPSTSHNMDYKYINQLLERYWNGETSLEEEQILRSFFSQLCVPEELAKYRSLFNYEQTEAKADRLGDDFDERIMSMIDEPHEVKAQPIRISQRFAPLFKAVAMVAIVLTLTQAAQISFQSHEASNTAMPGTYTSKPVSGVSVAQTDSAHIDSMKKAAMAEMPQQLEQNDYSMLK